MVNSDHIEASLDLAQEDSHPMVNIAIQVKTPEVVRPQHRAHEVSFIVYVACLRYLTLFLCFSPISCFLSFPFPFSEGFASKEKSCDNEFCFKALVYDMRVAKK